MMPEDRDFRAGEAGRLLSEPLLVEAFDTVEQAAIEEMLSAPVVGFFGDRKRRRMADRVNAIRALREELKTIITIGKVRR